MTKLTDLCDIQYGYAFDSGAFTNDNSYPQLVRIRDVKRGYSETFYNGDYPDEYVLSAGDLLIGMDGEFNIARWKIDGALLNQRVCKIVAKDNTDEEFLRFALSKALKVIEDRTSFVTVKHLSARELNKLEIQVPSYDEQTKISDILHRLERIIDARQNELKSLDILIKARFVELYNTSFLGEETTIEAITERVKVGFVGTCEKYYTSNSGIPMLRTGNITNNGINLSDLKYVTNDFHEKNKKSQILEGDILIARHGSNGQANVYYGPEAQCLNAVVIVPNNEIATSVFLAGLINSPMVKEQIVRTLVGSTQHVVNTKSIAGLVVRIPNLEVQKEYEDFVNQIDKSKVVVSSKIKNAIFAIMLSVSFGQITSI